MSRLARALAEISELQMLAAKNGCAGQAHPLAKIIASFFYIAMLASLDKYALGAQLGMGFYPLWGMRHYRLSWRGAWRRLRIFLPLLFLVGAANPFYDCHCFILGAYCLNAGWVSFLALLCKGLWALLAAYLLVATTSIEQICHALRLLRVPKILVTQVLLIYRYLFLLLRQAEMMAQAYSLRAPGQRGIAFGAWGPLAGQLLLRSLDRADALYQSMLLRGYRGEFYYGAGRAWTRRDGLYCLLSCAAFAALRCLPWSFLFREILGGRFI